jgi:hypothetical protein
MSQKLKDTEDFLKAQVEKEAARIRRECEKQFADVIASLKKQHQQELNDIGFKSTQNIEFMKREYEQRIQDLMHQL